MSDPSASLLDHPIISERYFFPRHARLADPVIVAVDGAELHCHLSAPDADAPMVLHFHGNGEVVSDWRPDFAAALNQRGLAVFLAEYRGYGGSTGRPELGRMLDDALAAADATGTPPERTVVYGRSVGSLFALHVAAHRPVAGVVIESGIADVYERLAMRLRPDELGTDAETLRQVVASRLDHQRKLAMYQGPVLVLHARGDDLVPPDNAERLARWAGDRARLILYDRGDHNSIHYYNGADILDEVARFARACVAAVR